MMNGELPKGISFIIRQIMIIDMSITVNYRSILQADIIPARLR